MHPPYKDRVIGSKEFSLSLDFLHKMSYLCGIKIKIMDKKKVFKKFQSLFPQGSLTEQMETEKSIHWVFESSGIKAYTSVELDYHHQEWWLCFHNSFYFGTPSSVVFDIIGESSSHKFNLTRTFTSKEKNNILGCDLWDYQKEFVQKLLGYNWNKEYSDGFETLWGNIRSSEKQDWHDRAKSFLSQWKSENPRSSYRLIEARVESLEFWFNLK